MSALYDKLAAAAHSYSGSGFEQLCLEMIAMKLANPDLFHWHADNPALLAPTEEDDPWAILGIFDNYAELGSHFADADDWINCAKIIDEADIPDEGDFLGQLWEEFLSHGQNGVSKKRGEYFTPPMLARLVCRLAIGDRDHVDTLYDPTCGSGGLLVEAIRELGIDNIGHVWGQEINHDTANLAKLNFYLTNSPIAKTCIVRGDTLSSPQLDTEDKCDCIVANPPYGLHWEGGRKSPFAKDPRFSPLPVMPPSSSADWAFLSHICWSLRRGDGRAAVLQNGGALFRSGEKLIRAHFCEKGWIKAVIHLPAGLFTNTSIPVDLLLLEKWTGDQSTYFLDASQICEKGKPMTEDEIDTIYRMAEHREVVEGVSYHANLDEIAANDYCLSTNMYVHAPEKRDPDWGRWKKMTPEELIYEMRAKRQERMEEIEKREDELLKLLKEMPKGKPARMKG